MSPSGLNFTQVNPLIQQQEKRVKSSDLQAPRVLWERSNCPSLNSLSARHLSPSCLLLLTPSQLQSPPPLHNQIRKPRRAELSREGSSFLALTVSGSDCYFVQEGPAGGRAQRWMHEPVLGIDTWNNLPNCCCLSSVVTALEADIQPVRWLHCLNVFPLSQSGWWHILCWEEGFS